MPILRARAEEVKGLLEMGTSQSEAAPGVLSRWRLFVYLTAGVKGAIAKVGAARPLGKVPFLAEFSLCSSQGSGRHKVVPMGVGLGTVTQESALTTQ